MRELQKGRGTISGRFGPIRRYESFGLKRSAIIEPIVTIVLFKIECTVSVGGIAPGRE